MSVAWVPPEVYRNECLRRRRAGLFISADGMGRVSRLLTEAGCYYDKKMNEWLTPDQAMKDAVAEIRHLLDMAAVPRVVGFGGGVPTAKEAREREAVAAREAARDRESAETKKKMAQWDAELEEAKRRYGPSGRSPEIQAQLDAMLRPTTDTKGRTE